MGITSSIKEQVKKSGTNKGKFIYFKSGAKIRVRFLQEMDDGFEVLFHDSFSRGINIPCQEAFGRKCSYCDDDDLRTRPQYIWSVWDYEANEVRLMMFPVNNCTPINALLGMSETYNTIMDRDYVIQKQGSQQTSNYSVVPMDKTKFKNSKAKPFSKSKVLDLIDKAWPDDDEDQGSKKNKKKGSKSKPVNDDYEDDEEELDYDDMSAKELYNLCQERDIEVKPRKDAEYYAKKLREYDEENEEDTDADDDDSETETDVDYEEMSAKELYELCQERDIKVEKRKPESYYIKKLKAADEAVDDDDEEDDWDE